MTETRIGTEIGTASVTETAEIEKEAAVSDRVVIMGIPIGTVIVGKTDRVQMQDVSVISLLKVAPFLIFLLFKHTITFFFSFCLQFRIYIVLEHRSPSTRLLLIAAVR